MDILCSSVPSVSISGKPKASSASYGLATAIAYNRPYVLDDEYGDLAGLAAQLQQDYEGNASNVTTPLTVTQIIDALNKNNIKFIDEQALVDSGKTANDYTDLRHELASLGRSGYIILVTIASDKKLALANSDGTQGALLHQWSSDTSYTLVRTGFSDSAAFGYYQDALLSSLPLPKYLPILWSNITTDCDIVSALAIAPSSLEELPPSDFRYFGGLDTNGNPITNTWPIVEKSFDPTPIIESIKAAQSNSDSVYSTQIQQINELGSQIASSLSNVASLVNTDKTQSDTVFMSLLQELGYKGDTASAPTQPTSSSDTPAQPVAPTPPSSASDEPTQPTSTDVVPATPTSVTTQQLPETTGGLL